MANEPQYLLPEPAKEIARLTEQDAVITHMMKGKHILAQIDLTKPGLRILDSGTADGLLLRAIQPLLTEPFTLLGYDTMQSFFPSTVPPRTTFAIHDIADPWPAELHGTCDLVHQRFTIPGGTKKATPREIVRNLCQLVKPGGWIQLVEMDVTGTVHGPAMCDAWAATGAFLTAAGAGTDYAKNMAGWLREEGFENVHDERVDLDVGARVKDAEWATRSARILVEAFTAVADACQMMKLDLHPSVSESLDELPERVEEEMMKQGGTYPLVFAFAQKPIYYMTDELRRSTTSPKVHPTTMKSTPEEIEAALANYRKITAERNKRALQVFVDAIANADFEDEETATEFTEEEMKMERMGQLGYIVQDDLDGLGVTQPTELMDRYDELAPKLCLDGTFGGDLDSEERASLAEAYFEALEAALRERAPDDVKETISAPEEFRVMARHILRICGPGLPINHTRRGMGFSCVGSHSEIASLMLAPVDTYAELVLDGRVALGWKPGRDTVNCEWICVYAQESDGSWAWKFQYSNEGDIRAFDTIPDLLEWFLEVTDEEAPVLEGITAENVIDCAVWDLR